MLYSEKTKSFAIQIYGAHQVCYDLENIFNIVPNKSLTLKYPFELELWSKDLIKAFIIGYIDGDGCIKFCKRDKTLILDIFSGSLNIIKWFKSFLEQEYNLPEKNILLRNNK